MRVDHFARNYRIAEGMEPDKPAQNYPRPVVAGLIRVADTQDTEFGLYRILCRLASAARQGLPGARDAWRAFGVVALGRLGRTPATSVPVAPVVFYMAQTGSVSNHSEGSGDARHSGITTATFAGQFSRGEFATGGPRTLAKERSQRHQKGADAIL
jgi:hypothetical protein